MALTLSEIKELIAFGQACGLQSLAAEGVTVVYGGRAPSAEEEQPKDVASSTLPEELRHYSAAGKAAFGKAGK